MTRVFELSSTRDLTVPVEVLEELTGRLEERGMTWVVIGALARDLTVHGPLGHRPSRATDDVDVAIAVGGYDEFADFTALFDAAGLSAAHQVRVHGVKVDVVPFGALERDGSVEMGEGHVLNVVGLREAAAEPDLVALDRRLQVPVASLEAQTVLKWLAWRDRRYDGTKDAVDLATLLQAASEGIYGDEMWSDDRALGACGYDPVAAGAWRLGFRARMLFTDSRARHVTAVLADQRLRDLLVSDMRVSGAGVLVNAYITGFLADR